MSSKIDPHFEREINRGKQIKHLYLLTQKLMPILGISNESIKY